MCIPLAVIFAFALALGLAIHSLERGLYGKRFARCLLQFVECTMDVGELGTLLDLYSIGGRSNGIWHDVHKATSDAVARLLPLLRPADADALDTQQRAYLRRDLFHVGVLSHKGYWRGSDYCLPVLSALEQIGDKRDLHDIERLLKKGQHG